MSITKRFEKSHKKSERKSNLGKGIAFENNTDQNFWEFLQKPRQIVKKGIKKEIEKSVEILKQSKSSPLEVVGEYKAEKKKIHCEKDEVFY